MSGTRDIADLLKATTDVVLASTDVDSALQWAVDVVCGYTGWPLGHVVLLEGSSDLLTSAGIWHNDDPERFDPFVGDSEGLTFTTGEGLPGRIHASGEPAWIVDVRTDTNFPRAKAATEVGLAAAFGFPIRTSLGVEGVMEFFADEPIETDRELLDLIWHVGVQVGNLLDRARAEEALRESEARLSEAEVIGRAGSWSWVVGEGAITWSAELYRIHGIDPSDGPMTYRRYLDAIHPADRVQVTAAIEAILATLEPQEHEYRIITPAGEERWVLARMAVVVERDGRAERLGGFCQDVTERHQYQLELTSQQRMLERIARGEPAVQTIELLCTAIEARYHGVRCSVLLVDESEQVLRHIAAPSLPSSFQQAIDGLAIGEGACGMAAARRDRVVVADVRTDPITAGFVELADAHGLRSVWSHPLVSSDGEVIGTFALYRGVPHEPDEAEIRTVTTAGSIAALALERERTQTQLLAAANVDPLTGLPNRARFLAELERALHAHDPDVAVLFLDLDGFKWINDSLGHPAGDRILHEVAHRLLEFLGPAPYVARFGGDEFTVLLDRPTDQQIDAVADHVDAAFAEPFLLHGGEFFLSCSIGIARNVAGTGAYGVVRDADAAMYAAKESGRARRAVFDERLRERALGRVTLETDLRRGIERGEFVMHYQPIHDLRAGAWVGAEALVRWHHPARGLVAPGDFIPLAEETGLIVPLGVRILEMVVADRATWAPDVAAYASVNISVVQLADPAIATAVLDAVASHGLDPSRIVVEVTETALMERLDTAQRSLDRIRGSGVRVVIDDFGSGYSSIARLGELPIAGIKIDNRFTRTLGVDAQATQVVAAIADLAHAHALEVVVEGIETEEALAAARDVGCEYGQGFHLAAPMALDELSSFLAQSAIE